MRIYYIFNVKKEMYDLYKEYPKALYNIFFSISKMTKQELEYGFSLLKEITRPINKERLDEAIYLSLKDKYCYSNIEDKHIINNLYHEEVSIMQVKKVYIIINTIQNYTEFFNILNENKRYLFACDFKNDDYFFLSDIKVLV